VTPLSGSAALARLTSERSGLITSVLRFAAFYRKSSFLDPNYNAVELIIWTVCEPGVYLIAACLMMYRPLLDKLGISMITGTTTRGNSNGMSYGSARRKAGQLSENGTAKGIGLGAMSSAGFSQLDDNDESPLRKNNGIRTTTNVEVAWESV